MSLLKSIKEHYQNHKTWYIAGGVFLSATITLAIMRNYTRMPYLKVGAEWSERAPVEQVSLFESATFGDNASITTNIFKGVKGHPGFITRCISTGEIFTTQGASLRRELRLELLGLMKEFCQII